MTYEEQARKIEEYPLANLIMETKATRAERLAGWFGFIVFALSAWWLVLRPIWTLLSGRFAKGVLGLVLLLSVAGCAARKPIQLQKFPIHHVPVFHN